MSKIPKKMIWCAVLMTLSFGCSGWPGVGNSNGGGGSETPGFSGATLYNCTVINGPTAPPSGRAYNVFARVTADGVTGAWNAYGQLNSNLVAPTNCHAEAPIVKVDFAGQGGSWEIRALKMPRSDEPSCNSSDPNASDACIAVTHFVNGDPTAAAWMEIDFTSSDE